MVKRFLVWFLVFGLSYLVQALGLVAQGTAFVWLHFGGFALGALFVVLFGGWALAKASRPAIAVLTCLSMIPVICFPLFITQIAAEIFAIDFVLAYQVMTFGQCLIDPDKDED